jgi:hypothetical protein
VLTRPANVDVREVPARSLGRRGQVSSLQGLRARLAIVSPFHPVRGLPEVWIAGGWQGISLDTGYGSTLAIAQIFGGSFDRIVQNNFGL